MKNLIKIYNHFLPRLLLVLYLLFSFINWSVDPGEWSMICRIITIIIFLIYASTEDVVL